MQQEDIIWWETIVLKMSNISEQFLKCCLEVSLGEKKSRFKTNAENRL